LGNLYQSYRLKIMLFLIVQLAFLSLATKTNVNSHVKSTSRTKYKNNKDVISSSNSSPENVQKAEGFKSALLVESLEREMNKVPAGEILYNPNSEDHFGKNKNKHVTSENSSPKNDSQINKIDKILKTYENPKIVKRNKAGITHSSEKMLNKDKTTFQNIGLISNIFEENKPSEIDILSNRKTQRQSIEKAQEFTDINNNIKSEDLIHTNSKLKPFENVENNAYGKNIEKKINLIPSQNNRIQSQSNREDRENIHSVETDLNSVNSKKLQNESFPNFIELSSDNSEKSMNTSYNNKSQIKGKSETIKEENRKVTEEELEKEENASEEKVQEMEYIQTLSSKKLSSQLNNQLKTLGLDNSKKKHKDIIKQFISQFDNTANEKELKKKSEQGVIILNTDIEELTEVISDDIKVLKQLKNISERINKLIKKYEKKALKDDVSEELKLPDLITVKELLKEQIASAVQGVRTNPLEFQELEKANSDNIAQIYKEIQSKIGQY